MKAIKPVSRHWFHSFFGFITNKKVGNRETAAKNCDLLLDETNLCAYLTRAFSFIATNKFIRSEVCYCHKVGLPL
jgi:hypothetical protein